MTALSIQPAVNAAIADARDLPHLIANLQRVNPALADQLETKPLLMSRSPLGTFAVTAVVWLSARYGFGWDETTCQIIAGVGVLLGGYLMRAITRQPIAGVLRTPTGTPPAVPTPAAE